MTEADKNLRPAERRGPKRESSAMQRAASQISEVASEDARLVSAAQSGDRPAFARLFEKYRTPAYQIAFRLLGHQQDALDVVQESFIKAFVGLEKFRGGSSFKTWLYRIVTNCSLDRRRSRVVRKAGSLDIEEAPDPPDRSHESDEPWQNLERQELKLRIDAALAAIPENNRTAFVLFAIEGVSYREIAEILNISIGTVMSRIFYARQKLQAILSGQEPAEAADVQLPPASPSTEVPVAPAAPDAAVITGDESAAAEASAEQSPELPNNSSTTASEMDRQGSDNETVAGPQGDIQKREEQ